MWVLIFLIALVLGASWAFDLASGIAGLLQVIVILIFSVAGLMLAFVIIMWIINQFRNIK